jgi:hypothetical protein
MNILIAKMIVQDFINENDIALFYDDAAGNFYELREIAEEDKNEDVLNALQVINVLNMVHILANK